MKKLTNEDFLEKLKRINPDIKPIDKCNGTKNPIKYVCLKCGNIHSARPSNLLSGFGCPTCGRTNIGNSLRLTNEAINNRFDENNIELLSKYENQYSKVRCRCKKCGSIFEGIPKNIWKSHGCPICSGNEIGPAPLYKNSIWADTTKRQFFSFYISEADMKTHTFGSKEFVEAKCPDCGRTKRIKIYDIYRYNGINCLCSGNISLPNRLMDSLLSYLKIDFKSEYSPEWIKPKRYDFYLPDFEFIIEMNGAQHYKNVSKFNNDVKKQIEIDLFKKNTAISNGIKRYYEIDCSKSSLDEIINVIKQSHIFNDIGVENDSIDWDYVKLGTLTNFSKLICDDYNNGFSNKDLASKYNINTSEVSRYLIKGKELKFLTREILDSKTKQKQHKNLISEIIELYNNGDSVQAISTSLSVSETTIRKCLREFEQNNEISIAEFNGTRQMISNSKGETFDSIKEASDKYNIDLWNAVNFHLLVKNCYWFYSDKKVREKKYADFLSRKKTIKILELFNCGYKIIEISEKLKLNRNDIRNYLNLLSFLGKCNYNKRVPKKVFCIEKNKTFRSPNDASKECAKASSSHIVECCEGKRKTAGGYHWKFIE